MRVYSPISAHNRTIIQYYRLVDPLEAVAAVDESFELTFDDMHPAVEERDRRRKMATSDLFVIHASMINPRVPPCRSLSRVPPIYDFKNGELLFPPAFVIDVDDIYDNITPINPAFKVWGVMAGEKALKPGDDVTITTQEGVTETLWTDGEEGFDIADNWRRHAALEATFRQTDGITVSTPYLMDYYTRMYPWQPVGLVPNSYLWGKVPQIVPKDPKHVTILWTGASSHSQDLANIYKPLLEVMGRYKDVRFVHFGQDFPWFREGMEITGRFEFIEWVMPEAYLARLSGIGHDINLCPLADVEFNRGKSGIKWYENSIIGKPAATLARDMEPYREIEDGKTGMLYNTPEEFAQKLSFLIENVRARREMARAAKRWVTEHKDARKGAKERADFYRAVRRHQIAEMVRNTSDADPAVSGLESYVGAG